MTDTMHIMVVDDEPGMRMGVARALRDFSVRLVDINGEVRFEVEQAASGEEAIDKIHLHAPDILLLDHKLPGMTGLDVLETLAQEKHEDLLTVMITAYASLETAVAATKKGAYDFLAKPFTPEELKNTVRKAAGHLILERQARKLAAEKRQVRFQFISVLAHELKAPLAAIEGYLQIMKDHAAGDDPKVYDHMIDRSLTRAEHMRKLVGDLLDLTRIESGRKKREVATIDLREVTQQAIDTVNPVATPRGITINVDSPATVPLQADRGEIEIVMNNLVSNAVKYNRDGGRVDVRLKPAPDQVTIEVSDNGIGLTADEAAKLFNDFVRIKNEKTRNILGSGLGLSIVKKLAQLYNGDVNVQSEPDVGSTFTVVLRHTDPQATLAAQA